MESKKQWSQILYGGDYNPEQWPLEVVERDIGLMQEAGINAITLNVFGWSAIQPEKDRFDFERLDHVMQRLESAGIGVILATPTAAPPSWMYHYDPTMLRVDSNGRRVTHWSRQAYCPNHPLYIRESRRIARALAERYGKSQHLLMWHINNEYIVHCYCEYCAESFRAWLQNKYGSLEKLNEAWQLRQWSLYKTDWVQIQPPIGGMQHTSASLDYQRFLSDSNLMNYLAEKEEIIAITPYIPITTNFYSIDFLGQIHHDWAPYLDVVAWDSYPPHKDYAVWAAFQHDYFRGVKKAPFLLMEQAASNVNWKKYNPAKRPRMMALQSGQAIARGAEAVMFFQFRQSRGGVEKYHSAIISHGTESGNRVYKEICLLGENLPSLHDVIGSRIVARVAILFDVTLMWLIEWNKTSSSINYKDVVMSYYRPLYEANIPVDVVHPLSDFTDYDIVIAPMLYMFEDGVPDSLRSFVSRGGKLVMSYYSGMVNACDVVEYGGYLRPIDDLFGIEIEEWDALEPDMNNRILVGSREYAADIWAEVVNLNGAEADAVFMQDYYRGRPAVTRHRYGQGTAYYVATQPEQQFFKHWLLDMCAKSGITPIFPEAPIGVEITVREKNGKKFHFVLNHLDKEVKIKTPYMLDVFRNVTCDGELVLAPFEVAVLTEKEEELS